MLSDELEKQMRNTAQQGTYKQLFEGKSQSVVSCKNIDFESTRDDVFSTLQLSVKGNKSIEESIR
jgi:ubiquitin carboxyl-terminal hydrolase 7